jgi:hypothetical protein
MGWDSHSLMELVHENRHLGKSFDQPGIAASQTIYRQHLHQHVFGAHPSGRDFKACDLCSKKCLALESLPQIVRDEAMRLQRERKHHFQGLIDAIDRHFVPRYVPTTASGSNARKGSLQQQQVGAALDFSPIPVLLSANADSLALKLREIQLSDDASVLADMSANLRRNGIMDLQDLRGLTKEELQEEVSALNLKRVQLNKLFDAVSNL